MKQESQQEPNLDRLWSGDEWQYLFLEGNFDEVTAIGEEWVGKTGFLGISGRPVREVLNELGRQGWKLVSAYSVRDNEFRMVFKRPTAREVKGSGL